MLFSVSPPWARRSLDFPGSTPVGLADLPSISSHHLPYLNPGSPPTYRQIAVSTTMVDNQSQHTEFVFFKYILCSMLPCALNLCVLLAPSSPTPFLPAIHPVWSSTCLPASSTDILSSILACHTGKSILARLFPTSQIPHTINLWFNSTSFVCVFA